MPYAEIMIHNIVRIYELDNACICPCDADGQSVDFDLEEE